MARLAGVRKFKTLDDKILENEIKIQEVEDKLSELKAEHKNLLEQKEQDDLQEILKTIKESGLSIAEAKNIFVKNKA